MNIVARIVRMDVRPLAAIAVLTLAPVVSAQTADANRPRTDRAEADTDRAGGHTARAPETGPGPNVTGLGDLPPGKTLTIVFRASVDDAAFLAGKSSLASQGTLTGSNFSPTLSDDPDSAGAADPTLTILDAAPDLQITGFSDGVTTAVPGATLSYAVNYANGAAPVGAGNAGAQGASGVVLTSTVPVATVFNPGASTAAWSCAPNNNAGSVCTLAVGSLAAGASGSATFAVNVIDPVPAGITQIGTGVALSDDGANGADRNPADNTAMDVDTLNAQPDLALTKSDGGVSVAPGGTVAYTLSYSNVGNQGATGVALTETVPANTTFNAGASTAGWVCVPDNNAGSTCTLAIAGELAGGGGSGSATFAATVVDPVPAGVAQISNTASAADDATNGPDPNGANNTGSDTTPLNGAPDLGLSKSDGGASVVPGGTVAYTLSYSNTGNRGATGVVLTETVPANTTFNAGASTAGWACVPDNNAGSTCTLTIGAVPAAPGAGSSGTASFAVTLVNPVAAGVSQVSNSSSVADDGANGTDPVPANNDASDSTPVDAAPDFTMAKSDGGASVSPGGTVAYTLSYANAGNQGALGVVLTETVPAGTTFNAGASTAGWVCAPDNNAGSTCTLTVGGLNGGGASGNATFAVTVVNPAPSGLVQVSNTASVTDDTANGPDPTPGNNSGSDTTPVDAAPDLAVSKDDGSVSVAPGGTVAYTLDYSNPGNQDAVGVALTETVPANTTFNPGASTAGWVCVPDANAGSTCTLNIGALNGAGASGSATFAVDVIDPVPAGVAQISNTATVADDGSNGPDPNGGNNSGSDTTPVDAVPDLTLTKDDGGVTVNTGGTVAYTLSYANAGNQGAAGVTLTETVPANTTFNPGASTAGWACVPDNAAGSTCTLAVSGLNGGGASGSATFAVDVAANVPSGVTQISNSASVADDGLNGPDPNPGDNTGSDTTPLVAVPDMSLALTDNRVAAHGGQVLTYELSYQNAGSQDAVGVVLTEVVPLNTTFFDPPGTSGWSCANGAPGGTSCTLNVAGTVGAGAPVQAVQFRVKVLHTAPLGSQIVNDGASVDDDGSNGPDGNPGNNTAQDVDTVVTPKGDMNRPGGVAPPFTRATAGARTDILFQNDNSSRLVGWFMDYDIGNLQALRGDGNFTTPLEPSEPGFRVVGTDDFNDDGLTDILFRHNTDARLRVWLMNGMTRSGGEVTPSPASLPGVAWQSGGTGDMNDDGQSDWIWYNTNSGSVVAWLMNGTTRVTGQFTNPMTIPAGWRVVGTGQFNLGTDSHVDLLLQDGGANLQLWLMDGALSRIGGGVTPTPGTVPAGWQVVAVGDYNLDNQADLLLRSPNSGKLVTWFMNGSVRTSGNFTNPDSVPGSPTPSALAWRVAGPR